MATSNHLSNLYIDLLLVKIQQKLYLKLSKSIKMLNKINFLFKIFF